MPLYVPTPLPQPSADDAAAAVRQLALYVQEELVRIGAVLAIGQFQSIRLDQLNEFTDLPRPRDGDLAYFTENAAGVGQNGLYEWDSQTTQWKKL